MRWRRDRREATFSRDGELALIYVYVTPEKRWPHPSRMSDLDRSEVRDAEIVVDYDRHGNMLGVEVITKAAPDAL